MFSPVDLNPTWSNSLSLSLSADSVIFARLNAASRPLMKTTLEHLGVSSAVVRLIFVHRVCVISQS